MTIAEKIRTKGRAEGLTEGETKGRAEIIYKLYRSGMPITSIADIVELSIDEVKQLLEQKG